MTGLDKLVVPAPEQAIGAVLDAIAFNELGLVPAVAQQHDTGEVLMLAWMNRESVAQTLMTGRVCYWSRSRQALWRKGDTSGHTQHLVDFIVDCDGDTILLKVDQKGPACHTGRRSCFFRAPRGGTLREILPKPVAI
ncbi:MAG: phosphoribosyl-AMP cyclohydrolase [Alphaproteobacteria bacterium]|nr:phosphoribosyl-AMP cyclohydrolase [Alphaproteobacteria bacterium]